MYSNLGLADSVEEFCTLFLQVIGAGPFAHDFRDLCSSPSEASSQKLRSSERSSPVWHAIGVGVSIGARWGVGRNGGARLAIGQTIAITCSEWIARCSSAAVDFVPINLGPISRGAPAIVLKDFSPIHFGPIERLIGKPALWRLVGLHQLRDAGTFARIEALSTKTLVALIPVAMSRSTGSITREEATAAAGVPLLHRGAGHLPALSDLALPISGTKIGAALAFSIFAISSPRLGAAEPGTGAPGVLVAVKERGRPLGELALSSLHADRFGLHAVIHCAIRGIAIRGIGHLRHTLAGVMLKCLQCTTFTDRKSVV